MKNLKPIATYDKENSCMEDVLAIAEELARGTQVTEDLSAGKGEAPVKKSKKADGMSTIKK